MIEFTNIPPYLLRQCDKFGKRCIDVRCCADIRDRKEICFHDVEQVKLRAQRKRELAKQKKKAE